jgi:hypothetical protein
MGDISKKIPKATNRVVQSHRMSSIDGVKDVKIGPASVEARQQGNAHVTGKGVDRDDAGFTDVEERRKRHGFLY